MSFDSANALLLDLNEFLNAAANHNNNTDKQTAAANNAQWMENYGGPTFDLFAPDPDLFDSELEASADLSQLDIPFPAVQSLPPAAYYGGYRNRPASAFNGTVSSVSESQSGYNNDYDTASFYSGHESGYNHHITANGSLYSAHGAGGSAVGIGTAVPQQPHFHSTLNSQSSANSHFGTAGGAGTGTNTAASDLDLDFSEFNLSVNSGLHAALGSVPPLPPLQAPPAPAPAPGLGTNHHHHHRSHSHSTGAAAAVGGTTTVSTPAIDTSALNSVHLFMNPASVIPSFTTSQSSSQSPTDHPSTIANTANTVPSTTTLHHPQAEMYFPRHGDPHAPGMASASSQQSQQQGVITQQQQQNISQGSGQRPAKREATSSPAIPAPDFGGLDQLRPGKRLAASASQDIDEGSGAGGPNTKRYKCPSCERAFARAYNLKTHMATHDPHRVKAFVCRHTGCGRSFSRKHDLGRHYTSIHGGSTGIGPSSGPGNNSGNLSGEERAALRGHRAGSGSAYGRSSSSANRAGGSQSRAAMTEDDDDGSNSGGSSSTEGEAAPQPPVPPQLIQSSTSGSSAPASQNQQQIQHRERIWCDGCGRGWIKGTREACECDPSIRGTQFRSE